MPLLVSNEHTPPVCNHGGGGMHYTKLNTPAYVSAYGGVCSLVWCIPPTYVGIRGVCSSLTRRGGGIIHYFLPKNQLLNFVSRHIHEKKRLNVCMFSPQNPKTDFWANFAVFCLILLFYAQFRCFLPKNPKKRDLEA